MNDATSTETVRKHWSDEHFELVARECIKSYPKVNHHCWGHVEVAQTVVLPIEYRRRTLAGPALYQFREVVKRLREADAQDKQDAKYETTKPLIIPDSHSRSVDFVSAPEIEEIFSPIEPQRTPKPKPRPEPRQPLPAKINGIHPHPPSQCCEDLVGVLIQINQLTLLLTRMSGQELRAATRNPIDTARLCNLSDQAADGLSYFNRLVKVASEY